MVSKKLIIGLVGEKFAGKDAAANFLVQSYGAEHLRFSHLLDRILSLLNLPISRRNEIGLGLGLRQIFGGQVLGPALIKQAIQSKAGVVVINGIRMDEYESVKAAGAKIIYITAPADIRFKRYQTRHEKADDGQMDFEAFLNQEKELTEIGIPDLGKKADYKIENIGTLDELNKKVNEVVGRLIG